MVQIVVPFDLRSCAKARKTGSLNLPSRSAIPPAVNIAALAGLSSSRNVLLSLRAMIANSAINL